MGKKRLLAKNSTSGTFSPQDYAKLLEQIKTDIHQTQIRFALSMTKELIMFYWRTGKVLSEQAKEEGWGASTMERLAKDLKREFPDITGFSLRNIKYMRQFAESFPDATWAAAAAQIPWGHNTLLLDKVESPAKRLWYVQQVKDI